MSDPARPEVTSTRLVYENRWMRLREDRLRWPSGQPGLYAVVEKSPGAVVVPVHDNGDVHLIEQYRHPPAQRFWEFPQGAKDDDPDADPEDVARGELEEETGLRAGRLEHLGRLFYAYGVADQPFDAWLARDLTPGPTAPEPEEVDLRAARVPAAAFEAMVDRGEIADAATVAVWHLARRRLDRERTAG